MWGFVNKVAEQAQQLKNQVETSFDEAIKFDPDEEDNGENPSSSQEHAKRSGPQESLSSVTSTEHDAASDEGSPQHATEFGEADLQAMLAEARENLARPVDATPPAANATGVSERRTPAVTDLLNLDDGWGMQANDGAHIAADTAGGIATDRDAQAHATENDATSIAPAAAEAGDGWDDNFGDFDREFSQPTDDVQAQPAKEMVDEVILPSSPAPDAAPLADAWGDFDICGPTDAAVNEQQFQHQGPNDEASAKQVVHEDVGTSEMDGQHVLDIEEMMGGEQAASTAANANREVGQKCNDAPSQDSDGPLPEKMGAVVSLSDSWGDFDMDDPPAESLAEQETHHQEDQRNVQDIVEMKQTDQEETLDQTEVCEAHGENIDCVEAGKGTGDVVSEEISHPATMPDLTDNWGDFDMDGPLATFAKEEGITSKEHATSTSPQLIDGLGDIDMGNHAETVQQHAEQDAGEIVQERRSQPDETLLTEEPVGVVTQLPDDMGSFDFDEPLASMGEEVDTDARQTVNDDLSRRHETLSTEQAPVSAVPLTEDWGDIDIGDPLAAVHKNENEQKENTEGQKPDAEQEDLQEHVQVAVGLDDANATAAWTDEQSEKATGSAFNADISQLGNAAQVEEEMPSLQPEGESFAVPAADAWGADLGDFDEPNESSAALVDDREHQRSTEESVGVKTVVREGEVHDNVLDGSRQDEHVNDAQTEAEPSDVKAETEGALQEEGGQSASMEGRQEHVSDHEEHVEGGAGVKENDKQTSIEQAHAVENEKDVNLKQETSQEPHGQHSLSAQPLGAEVPPADPAASIRAKIKALYQEHNAKAAGDLDPILEKYKGKEYKLYSALCKKYGVEPDPEEQPMASPTSTSTSSASPLVSPSGASELAGASPQLANEVGNESRNVGEEPKDAERGEVPKIEINRSTCTEEDPTVAAYRAKLVNIYKEYNPEKLLEIDNLLVKFEGREDKLYAAVCKKYGVVVTDETAPNVASPPVDAGSLTSWQGIGASLIQAATSAGTSAGDGASLLQSSFGVLQGLKNVTSQFETHPSAQPHGTSEAVPATSPSEAAAAAPRPPPTDAATAPAAVATPPQPTTAAAVAEAAAAPQDGQAQDTESATGSSGEPAEAAPPQASPPEKVSAASIASDSVGAEEGTGSGLEAEAEASQTETAEESAKAVEPDAPAGAQQTDVPAAASPAEEENSDEYELYRERIAAFYRENNPEKISEVDNMLAKYRGKERMLYEAILRKYGKQDTSDVSDSSPPPQLPASPPETSTKGGGDEAEVVLASSSAAEQPQQDIGSEATSGEARADEAASAGSGASFSSWFQTIQRVQTAAEGLKKNVEKQFEDAVRSQEDASALDVVQSLRGAVAEAATSAEAAPIVATSVPSVAVAPSTTAAAAEPGVAQSAADAAAVSGEVLRELESLRVERDSLKAERDALRSERKGLIDEGTKMSKRMHAVEKRMKDMEQDGRRTEAKRAELEQAKTTLETKAAKLASRAASAEALADEQRGEIRRLGTELNKARSQIQGDQKALAEEQQARERRQNEQGARVKILEEKLQEQLETATREKTDLVAQNRALSASLEQARAAADSAESSLEFAQAEAVRLAEEQQSRLEEVELEFARQSLPYTRQIAAMEARLNQQEQLFGERETSARRTAEAAEAKVATLLEELQANEAARQRDAETRQQEVQRYERAVAEVADLKRQIAEAWSAREASEHRREGLEADLRSASSHRQAAEQRSVDLTERIEELTTRLAQQERRQQQPPNQSAQAGANTSGDLSQNRTAGVATSGAGVVEQQVASRQLEAESRRLRMEVEALKRQRDELTQESSQLQNRVESMRREAGGTRNVLLEQKFEAALQMIGQLQEELENCREEHENYKAAVERGVARR